MKSTNKILIGKKIAQSLLSVNIELYRKAPTEVI